MEERSINLKKYLLVLAITVSIFGTVVYFSNFVDEKRLEEIRSIEDKIALDILSSETQFSLLSESSCDDKGNLVLSEEINSLAEKLNFTEKTLGSDDPEVISLKQYYSLLLIKDYLLTKKIGEKCGDNSPIIIYFYSNLGDCDECERAGHVLTYIRDEYPKLRVYAFDYNLDLSAIRTLRTILKIENELPAIVINNKTFYGFKSIEEFEKIIPNIELLKEEATSTSKNS